MLSSSWGAAHTVSSGAIVSCSAVASDGEYVRMLHPATEGALCDLWVQFLEVSRIQCSNSSTSSFGRSEAMSVFK